MKTHVVDAPPNPSPKKYELVRDERTTLPDGTVLHRIRALKEFKNIKPGDLGGLMRPQDNLSQEGERWICSREYITLVRTTRKSR